MIRKIASIFLTYGTIAARYSSRIGNMFLAIATGIATMDNSELSTIIHNNKLEHKFTPKENVPEYGQSEFYDEGSIYFANSPIPIQIRPNEEKEIADVIKGKEYEAVANTELVSDAYQKETPGLDLLTKLAIVGVILAASILMVGIVALAEMGAI